MTDTVMTDTTPHPPPPTPTHYTLVPNDDWDPDFDMGTLNTCSNARAHAMGGVSTALYRGLLIFTTRNRSCKREMRGATSHRDSNVCGGGEVGG